MLRLCFVTLLFLTSTMLNAQRSRETAIERLLVMEFPGTYKKADVNQWWNERRVRIQKTLAKQLEDQSYLEIQTSKEGYLLNDERSLVKQVAQNHGSDGVLVGEFRGTTVEIALKSSLSGRVLASWSIPITIKDQNFEKNFSETAVRTIVTSFPYRGYILSIKGDEAMLNLGKDMAVKEGTVLDVIEFNDEKPTFSSPTTVIGRVVIKKASKNFAKAQVTNGVDSVKPFSKLAFSKETTMWDDILETKTHNGFWIGAGADFFFLDSQVTDSSSKLGQRIYQIPLAPFMNLEAGYHRLKASYTSGGASNDSNKVKFQKINASYQFLETQSRKWGYLHSLGVYNQTFKSEVQTNARYPLSSFSLTAPYYEFRAQTIIGSQLIYWASAQLYYPVFSSDSENGSSEAATSLGLGAETGIRLKLSDLLAIESGLKAMGFRQQVQNGGIVELQYGLFLKMIFLL